MSNQLFAFTFTPVQAFIAEARRGQDLFTGSRILSDMARAVFAALQTAGANPIYPPTAGQDDDIPNKLMFELPETLAASSLGDKSIQALHDRWNDFVAHALTQAKEFGEKKPDPLWLDIWKRQTTPQNYWDCFWAAVPLNPTDYRGSVDAVNRYLDGAKRARTFVQSTEAGMKDTLSGSRTALHTAPDKGDARKYWRDVYTSSPKPAVVNPAKLRPNGRERLDGIGFVKRFGIRDATLPNIPSVSTVASADYLAALLASPDPTTLNSRLQQYKSAIGDLPDTPIFRVRESIWPYDGDLLYAETLTANRLYEDYDLDSKKLAAWHLRALTEGLRGLYDLMGNEKPCPYFAVLRMDGDGMGEAVGKCKTAKEHREFSQKISNFATGVGAMLSRHHGSKIYAGGDDVLALLPLSTCVAAAQELAEQFRTITGCTMSAGIAIAHHMDPLDLVLRESSSAEHAAKQIKGKAAIAIRASKRSGSLILVAARWEHLERCNFAQFVNAFSQQQLSSKLAYDLRTLAEQFVELDTGTGFKDSATRLAAFKSQLRLELKRHIMVKDKNERERYLTALFTAASGWLDDLSARHPNSTVLLADWLILARFIGKRGAE